MQKSRNLSERLLAKIVIDENGHWIFTGRKDRKGYGLIQKSKKAKEGILFAHNVAYQIFIGPIPKGLVPDHLCRIHACCNPDHLEAVTRGENVLRGEGITAQKARQTACIKGHPLIAGNLNKRPDGHRQCQRCHTEWMRAYRLKRKVV